METQSKMNVENVANALANSAGNCNVNLADALDGADDFTDTYNAAAEAIVEPIMSDKDNEAYGEWMENDPENWAGFVRSICGDEWYEIALKVNENGY